ncbi:ral guanine nucleotide dissociation stimulator-like 2 isoform X3 [Equus przewalskii]|uniref:Ral guanine nucleotide dissociation stimulator-like 2 isoform X3 n=1 Tax=Equus przewalskii TaxID=9798 RepID=A0ABM4MLA6_EQUPR
MTFPGHRTELHPGHPQGAGEGVQILLSPWTRSRCIRPPTTASTGLGQCEKDSALSPDQAYVMLTPRQAQWRTWQSPWASLPGRSICTAPFLCTHQAFVTAQQVLGQLSHRRAWETLWAVAGEGLTGRTLDLTQVTFTDSDVDCHHPLLLVHLELPEATEAEPQVPAPGLQATAEPEQWPVVEELFRKVVPSQCLGSSWCKRIKPGNEHLAPTIQATVDHFQRVVNFITTTCLSDPSRTARDRARLVEHWIQVAQECNILMNFSLHTVISALQKTSISRLENTWGEVSQWESSENFKKLCRKDKSLSRELMTKAEWRLESGKRRVRSGPPHLPCQRYTPRESRSSSSSNSGGRRSTLRKGLSQSCRLEPPSWLASRILKAEKKELSSSSGPPGPNSEPCTIGRSRPHPQQWGLGSGAWHALGQLLMGRGAL